MSNELSPMRVKLIVELDATFIFLEKPTLEKIYN